MTYVQKVWHGQADDGQGVTEQLKGRAQQILNGALRVGQDGKLPKPKEQPA